MARPTLRRPDQPPWLRFLLGLYEAAASLKLAVVVIAGSAIVLGWATFVESWYGAQAVQFGIYHAWWFTALLALLGLNVLCAALIRYPWKKYQIGFLVTHAGILVLLLGCLIQKVSGVDAQMVIFEADDSHQAFGYQKHFQLRVQKAGESDPDAAEEIDVRFRSGPFNWDDYADHFFFPWRLVPRDRGLLYDRDGIRLEVLGYYADSKQVPIPRIELEVRPGAGSPAAAMGGAAQPMSLAVSATDRMAHFGVMPYGRGEKQVTFGGCEVAFWMTGSADETAAFLDSRPQGELGPMGQVILWADGKSYPLSVAELNEKKPIPLGETGIEVKLLHWNPSPLSVLLEVTPKGKSRQLVSLLADHPYANSQDYRDGVFGTYWYQAPQTPAQSNPADPSGSMNQRRPPRIDILLGPDGKLYQRQVIPPEVVQIGPWPEAKTEDSAGVVGSTLTAFPQSRAPLELRVKGLLASDKPTMNVEPLPFDKQRVEKGLTQPRARVRLTVDGNSGEFWLPIWLYLYGPPTPDQQGVVVGADRRVEMVMTYDTYDLGFQIYLRDFKRKLDSGSRMESHYSSLVDLLDREDPPKRLQKNVLITMNEPLSATDPKTRRTYRLYQASFRFVAKAGDPDFDKRIYRPDRKEMDAVPREDLYTSTLTVNYDPGRGVKYAGSLLIVAGIVIMFFMRAYFFHSRSAEVPNKA